MNPVSIFILFLYFLFFIPTLQAGNYQDTEKYYRALLQKYETTGAVNLEDFNRTFFKPEAATSPEKENLLRCKDRYAMGHCTPDTFYSWGPSIKIQNAYKETSKRNSWVDLNQGKSVYMTQTSVGSYCYGDFALRLKFKQPPAPTTLNRNPYSANFNEWYVSDYGDETSASRIHSISYGTPEHFDEIITEITLRLQNSKSWHLAPSYHIADESGSLKLKLLSACIPEQKGLDEKVLIENLVFFLKTIFKREGWIHFQDCPTCKREDHFTTKWPTFFNAK